LSTLPFCFFLSYFNLPSSSSSTSLLLIISFFLWCRPLAGGGDGTSDGKRFCLYNTDMGGLACLLWGVRGGDGGDGDGGACWGLLGT
jgi:hypothetical protein